MARITYIEHNGKEHVVEVASGLSVMEGAVKNLVPGIDADCGGACACATCHVIVDDAWTDKLHPARDDEEDMLDNVPNVMPASRLSCQLIYSEELDGLTVALDPNLVEKARAA